MVNTFVAVSAIVPSLLLVWYFHRRDIFREPARDLWTVFASGFLIVLPVLAVARPIDPLVDSISSPLLYATRTKSLVMGGRFARPFARCTMKFARMTASYIASSSLGSGSKPDRFSCFRTTFMSRRWKRPCSDVEPQPA